MKFVQSVLISSLVLGGHFLSTPANAQESTVSCEAGNTGAALLVNVENIRTEEGNLRAQVYSSNPDDFLAKGKKLVRLDVPVTTAGEQAMCVQLPGAGKYALVIMHDKNANGKADFFSEGFGFSRNPKLGLGAPDAEEVIMEMPAGVTETTVRLKYILGGDDEKKEKRRKLRRR